VTDEKPQLNLRERIALTPQKGQMLKELLAVACLVGGAALIYPKSALFVLGLVIFTDLIVKQLWGTE